MKTLYVLRHSKAGQTNKRILDDHDRGLTKKGERLCEMIAGDMLAIKAQFDVVLCSTARRCVETYEAVKRNYPINAVLEPSPHLYLADVQEILRHVRRIDNIHGCALVIGHNPGLQEFCLQVMSHSGEKKLQKELKNQFSPPTLVAFQFATGHWQDVAFDGGTLTHYFRAKEVLRR